MLHSLATIFPQLFVVSNVVWKCCVLLPRDYGMRVTFFRNSGKSRKVIFISGKTWNVKNSFCPWVFLLFSNFFLPNYPLLSSLQSVEDSWRLCGCCTRSTSCPIQLKSKRSSRRPTYVDVAMFYFKVSGIIFHVWWRL